MRNPTPAVAALALAAALAACGGGGPAPGGAGDRAADSAGAGAPGAGAYVLRDPRLVLFDVQTALDADVQTSGSYPSTSDFRLADKWRVQRETLDRQFDDWSYTRTDGGYRLEARRGGKAFSISGGGG